MCGSTNYDVIGSTRNMDYSSLETFLRSNYKNLSLDFTRHLKNFSYEMRECADCEFVWLNGDDNHQNSTFQDSDLEFKTYHEYLLTRSWRSVVYKKIFLYPRISQYLRGRVLDVGCGIGDFLKQFPNAIGADINPYNVKYCQSLGLDCAVLDSNHFQYADGYFDAVTLDNVLEHLQNPNLLLTNINRILSSNGHLIIGVPGLKGYAQDSDHKVYYDEHSLDALLTDFGFEVIKHFYTPFKSQFLNKKMSQYCLYGVFRKCG